MKKQLVGFIVVAMMTIGTVAAQNVVGSGCVGDCGNASNTSFVAHGNPNKTIDYVITPTVNNLCISDDAFVTITFPNSIDIAIFGNLSKGPVVFTVPAGQELVNIDVTLRSANNGIVCVQLGRVEYEVRRVK